MKILTVYFSKTGHTKAIAEMIHKAVGGELGEIRTKRSYAPSYGMAVLQGGLEQLRKSLPELAEMPETAEYDVIFVGSPRMVVYAYACCKKFHQQSRMEREADISFLYKRRAAGKDGK